LSVNQHIEKQVGLHFCGFFAIFAFFDVGVRKIQKSGGPVRFLPWGRGGRGLVNCSGTVSLKTIAQNGVETPLCHFTASRAPPLGGNLTVRLVLE